MSRADTYNDLAETLLRHVENDTTDQADTSLRVPTRDYLDPDRWAREMELIFRRLPLMLALSIELPKAGDYKAIDVVGRPVLITRGKDGVARAFLNVCSHRGAPLTAAGSGNCNRFSCPYHGWTFANDGRLIGVAEAHKFGEFDRENRDLKALPCEERAGMIFVVLTPGLPIDVRSFLGGMLDDLASFKLETWCYQGAREIFGANWKVAYDGYLEGYHFAALHGKTLAPSFVSGVNTFESFGPHLRIGFAETGIRKLHDIPRDTWWSHDNAGYNFVRTLFPNISIALGLGVGQIAQLLPGPTPDKNRTILNYITPAPARDAAEQATFDAAIQFVRDVTNNEDYELGETIQKGLEAQAYDSVVFGRNERGNQFFHKCVDHYLGDHPGEAFPCL